MDLLDLFVRIGVKDEASENVGSLSNKLKNGLATAGKVAAAGVAATTSAVGALSKVSLDAYATYEQLVGGVDTLFKDSADQIKAYAENAYQTAGVSANTYMEQATAFSASLIQSLGGDTAAAAEYANQAIMDMSDNANKMGTDIESIQATYQSLMRGNYAMLDNLKLGYGGTKEELERLVSDAEKLTGQALDPSKFSDVITAIHAVQEEMGITGTTAREASTTIEGSVNAAKAAWSNLITGIADENADLDTLIGNFVDSAATAADNIIPRLAQILAGMGQAVQQIAPVLATQIPQIVTQVLPSMVSAGGTLLIGLVDGLISAIPQLISAAPTVIMSFVSALQESGPSILASGVQMLDMLTSGIENGIPNMVSRLPQVIETVLNFITDNLPAILNKGVEILTSLSNGIINSIPDLIDKLPQIITAIYTFIAENLPKISEAGIEITLHIASGIIGAIPNLVSHLPEIISAIVDGIKALMGSVVEVGADIVRGIWKGISGMAGWLGDQIAGFFGGIVDGAKSLLGIHSPSTVFADMGKNMALGLGEGWDNQFGSIKNGIESGLSFGTASVDFASSGMGALSRQISSTSRNAYSQTFDVTLEIDKTVLARKMYRANQNEAAIHGTSLVQGVT